MIENINYICEIYICKIANLSTQIYICKIANLSKSAQYTTCENTPP